MKPPSSWSRRPSSPPSVPLGALPDTQHRSSCELPDFRIHRNQQLKALSGHMGAPSPHTLGFWARWSRTALLSLPCLPGVGVHRTLYHCRGSLGRCLPSSPKEGCAALRSLTLLFLTERLEGAPPAYRGGVDALNTQHNPGSKSSEVDGQHGWLP